MTSHADPGRAAAGHHREPNYMMVFLALFVFTVMEIGVVYMPLARLVIGFMLVILAFTKAFLVAAFFMHLKFENRTLAAIAATPIVLCVFLMFMLLPDHNPAKVKQPAAPPAAGTAHTSSS